jgi:hypothetical protein
MVAIVVGNGPRVLIAGHGMVVCEEFMLAPGITVTPAIPRLPDALIVHNNADFKTTFGALAMERIANFSLAIDDAAGGKALAVKAWNSLWTFSLLALACKSPVMSLYSAPEGSSQLSLANRNIVINPLPTIASADIEKLQWAREHYEQFNVLVGDRRFQAAQRYYNNSHYLFDDDAKIMLLWAGIEGLLGVDSELRRRIALHAAILHDGDASAKAAHFTNVKKAYDIRSKVVHGTGADATSLKTAYAFASEVLVSLLRKMVELGRVPPASELDQLAVAASL